MSASTTHAAPLHHQERSPSPHSHRPLCLLHSARPERIWICGLLQSPKPTPRDTALAWAMLSAINSAWARPRASPSTKRTSRATPHAQHPIPLATHIPPHRQHAVRCARHLRDVCDAMRVGRHAVEPVGPMLGDPRPALERWQPAAARPSRSLLADGC
jgi:hypothetical protein